MTHAERRIQYKVELLCRQMEDMPEDARKMLLCELVGMYFVMYEICTFDDVLLTDMHEKIVTAYAAGMPDVDAAIRDAVQLLGVPPIPPKD